MIGQVTCTHLPTLHPLAKASHKDEASISGLGKYTLPPAKTHGKGYVNNWESSLISGSLHNNTENF